jgi:predicted Fe-S protein YdhL (DUF1289 family)
MTQNLDTDDIWKRDEAESPCIKICVIHPETRLCTGCLRSIDEITAWAGMTHQTRHDILADLPNRAVLHQTRRGGRAARIKRRET